MHSFCCKRCFWSLDYCRPNVGQMWMCVGQSCINWMYNSFSHGQPFKCKPLQQWYNLTCEANVLQPLRFAVPCLCIDLCAGLGLGGLIRTVMFNPRHVIDRWRISKEYCKLMVPFIVTSLLSVDEHVAPTNCVYLFIFKCVCVLADDSLVCLNYVITPCEHIQKDFEQIRMFYIR